MVETFGLSKSDFVKYIETLVADNPDSGYVKSWNEISRDLKKLRKSIAKNSFDKRSSLEILREIRYGER